MGRINSRRKGKSGEKKARKVLQGWTGLEFAGVPASGGLRWKKAENISGDIVCTDALHRFDFSIEVKNYRDINFEHLLTPNINSRILDEFWPQCTSDAERGKKLPLLMMRYDGIRPGDFFFCVMNFQDFKLFKPHLGKQAYIRFGKLVIMGSDKLIESPYKKIKSITTKIIAKKYA